MINGVEQADYPPPTFPNPPTQSSSLSATILDSNHSTINSSKSFSFKKLFCNNKLTRTIAQVVSNILFYIRNTRLGSYLLGPNPFQNAPLLPSLFSTEGLTLEYVKKRDFDTCIINGEQFALIDNRSILSVPGKGAENTVINLPDHHLVILDPVSAFNLTLQGKSVTLITSLAITGDLMIKVPKETGKVIFYGGTSTVNVKGNCTVTTKEFIQRGSRIETIHIEGNGHDEIVDYFAIVKDLFRKGIATCSSVTITHALLKAGHEILFPDQREVSRSDIFKLWGISL